MRRDTDYGYTDLLPKTLSPAATLDHLAPTEHTCIECGAAYLTASRQKPRCDACQARRRAKLTAKYQERYKARRKAAKHAQ